MTPPYCRRRRRTDPSWPAAAAAGAHTSSTRVVKRVPGSGYWFGYPFRALVGRGRVSHCDAIDADEFLDAKVAVVRASTADAPPPLFEPVPPGCDLSSFRLLTVNVVIAAVRVLPNKQSASDPIPTRLLKDSTCLCPPARFHLHSSWLTSRSC